MCRMLGWDAILALKYILCSNKRSLPEEMKWYDVDCSSGVGLQVSGWLCHAGRSTKKRGGSFGPWDFFLVWLLIQGYYLG